MAIFSDEIQALLDYDSNKLGETTNRVDVGLAELKQIYAENFPYLELNTINGVVYIWTDSFITKCTNAMSNGSLSDMNAQERVTWESYVAWSDARTTSADSTQCGGLAIGCTIPDINGDSFVVCSDGTITAELCHDGLLEYPNETVLKSLDNVFMNILNCLPYNVDDTLVGDITEVSTCEL